MSQTATTDSQEMVGEIALDRSGEEIGSIRGIYLQNGTRRPEWAAIEVIEGELTLVPLVGATATADGVWLPVDAREVAAAPARHADLPRQVSDDDATKLYRHYGGGARRRAGNGSNGSDGARRTRGRRRATPDGPSGEVMARAAEAAEEGRRVTSVAAERSQEVASTAGEEGQRVASTTVRQGREVARTAASQAGDVAATTKEQASQVSAELSDQARTLVHDTRAGLQEQAQAQTKMLADSMRRLGEEAKALADGRPEQAGVLAEYVWEAAERLTNVAQQIEARGPEGLIDEVKSFARTRPGTFVLGAAVAGFGIGRLLRSAGESDGSASAQPAADSTEARGI